MCLIEIISPKLKLEPLSLLFPQLRRFLSCWNRGNRSSLSLSAAFTNVGLFVLRQGLTMYVALARLELIAIPLFLPLDC